MKRTKNMVVCKFAAIQESALELGYPYNKTLRILRDYYPSHGPYRVYDSDLAHIENNDERDILIKFFKEEKVTEFTILPNAIPIINLQLQH